MSEEHFYIDGNSPFFRKLCRDCKKVLDYLAISEVIETMEDLVQFVKDLRYKIGGGRSQVSPLLQRGGDSPQVVISFHFPLLNSKEHQIFYAFAI